MKMPQLSLREYKNLALDVRDAFDSLYKVGERGIAEIWLQEILALFKRRGDDLLTKELLDEESKIFELGLQHDYVDALVEVTGATLSNTALLVTATSSQRIQACKMVRAYQTNSETQLPLTLKELN